MKFWAKVRFRDEKNVEYVIRSFFKEFNPQSSIVIKGKDVKLEIFFDDNPPMEIIEAIYHCDVIELNYGKALGEYCEDENEPVVEKKETLEQTAQAETKEEATSEQTTQKTATPKAKNTKVINAETVKVSQLEEIAEKATSFEHFAKLVAEWLEMGKRQDFFVNLVIASTKVEKMSWKELEKALENEGVSYSEWDKIYTGRQVSEKLKEYSLTTLTFLNVLGKYKDYSFGQEMSEEVITEHMTEENEKVVEEQISAHVEENTSKNRVKMECMPEIPHFEETLESVDKTQPIEDRVRYVLAAMGWEKKNAQEQQKIFDIANAAVRIETMTFDSIFLKANIPMESSMEARMTFSKFINDFVSEYAPEKKVKLLDFLKELQKIVMHESEIERVTDCNN